MFEIYREADYQRRYRVVYFTELDEHNKDAEISRAMAGEHYFDGFLASYESAKAKKIVDSFVDRLNGGETVEPKALEAALGDFLVA